MSAACRHCDTPIRGTSAYCCAGCEAAAGLVEGMGLERWYADRVGPAPRPDQPRVRGLDELFSPDDDGRTRVRLRLDGLRCASCVWLVERVLEADAGVVDAHVSFASGNASLTLSPGRRLSDVLAPVQDLGYRPAPLGQPVERDRGLLLRLGVSAFLAVNVMLLSATLYIGWVEPIRAEYAQLFRLVSLALAAPVAVWAAEPFHRAALAGLRRGVLHLDLPVSLAVTALFAHGVHATFAGLDTYLDSLVMLVALLLAGRVVERHGRRRVAEAAVALAGEAPGQARVHRGGDLVSVAAGEVRVGEDLELGAGERLVADGVVTSGDGAADLSLVTGESAEVPVRPGSELPCGATLLRGGVRVRATRVGEDTQLGRTARALAQAADEPLRDRSERLAGWFTAGTLGAAGLAFALHGSLEPAVAALVAACPCALALAGPLSRASGLGAAARRGLLLRSPRVLEALAQVRTIQLDKTGTLTQGQLDVGEVDPTVLRLAAGLERSSVHPIGRALVRAAIARGLPLSEPDRVLEVPGRGIHGRIDGHDVRVGAEGDELVIRVDGARHVVQLRDRVRPETAATLRALEALGVRPAMLTGDRHVVAGPMAASLGVADVRAEVTPLQKLRAVAQPHTLFVGDGLNDAAALAAAPVGIAMHSGAAPSLLAADGVLVRDGIAPLRAGIVAARAAVSAERTSRRRAVVYNVVVVAAALAGWVDPLVAAIAMPLSSAMVLWTAWRVDGRVARELA